MERLVATSLLLVLLILCGCVTVTEDNTTTLIKVRTVPYMTTTSTPTTTTHVGYCMDSDNGENPFNKGVVEEYGFSPREDSCLGERKLVEWVCARNRAVNITYQCVRGCLDGACVIDAVVSTTTTTTTTTTPSTTTLPTTTSSTTTTSTKSTTSTSSTSTTSSTSSFFCLDSDGGDEPYIFGVLIENKGNHSDYCLGTNRLIEWYCLGERAESRLIYCPLGCFSGVCSQVKATSTTLAERKPPCGNYGDINSDGYVTSADLQLIGETTPLLRGDVNGNNMIDPTDTALLIQYINRETDTFPVCL